VALRTIGPSVSSSTSRSFDLVLKNTSVDSALAAARRHYSRFVCCTGTIDGIHS
jgi:hypothetical protein